MRDLLYFTFSAFGKPTEFQDRLRTGRPVLVLGNDSWLKLCQTPGWPDPAKEAHSSLLPSPGQPTRHCWPMQRHTGLLQPWSPCLDIFWQGALARPPEFSSQLMSCSLFCHQVGSKEMLWGGISMLEDLPRLVCLWKNLITGKGRKFSGWVYRLWNTLHLLIKAVTADLFKGLTQENSLWPRVVKWEWLWTPCPNVQPLPHE